MRKDTSLFTIAIFLGKWGVAFEALKGMWNSFVDFLKDIGLIMADTFVTAIGKLIDAVAQFVMILLSPLTALVELLSESELIASKFPNMAKGLQAMARGMRDISEYGIFGDIEERRRRESLPKEGPVRQLEEATDIRNQLLFTPQFAPQIGPINVEQPPIDATINVYTSIDRREVARSVEKTRIENTRRHGIEISGSYARQLYGSGGVVGRR